MVCAQHLVKLSLRLKKSTGLLKLQQASNILGKIIRVTELFSLFYTRVLANC
jgi:hypothetical protein